ncbi:MAG TPA: NAD(P)-dependent oxidoreductase [Verrucomicrobiae bacterium]|nr:NAD(P)-dependent oxidoreductase [Verrucomicrobiae bacterium]
MDLRRIILLGHNGFIGSRLEAAFRRQYPRLELAGFSFPGLDLAQPRAAESLAELFDPQTAVVMTAGVKRQWGDTLDAFSQNMNMAVNVARLLPSHPVRRFVFFSSAAVYGEERHDEQITEDTPVRPTSYYGTAKFASECVLRKALPTGFVAIRPPLVYGPGDTSKSYGPAGFVYAAARGEPITLWGEGDEKREFIFVDDVVELTVRLVFHDHDGVLNIVSGRPCTFRQAADIVCRCAPTTIISRPRSRPKVDHGFRNRQLTRLFPDFNFHSLEDGIGKTVRAELRK